MLSEQRFLVVDAQPIVRNALKLILWNSGCKDVAEAEDSVEAQAIIRSAPPTMIICEILIPPRDGLSFLQELRSGPPEQAEIPVIFLTSQSKPETIEAAAKLGVDAYLLKPVTAKGLTAAIGKVLKERAKRPH